MELSTNLDLTAALGLSSNNDKYIYPDWPVPIHIKTMITTRNGGVSEGDFQSLNLGLHVEDIKSHVLENRKIVQNEINVPIAYLNQVHGTQVVDAITALDKLIDADASIDNTGKVACAVMTADCLPILFTDHEGTVIAAAHAGWRGLVNGIIEKTIQKMNVPHETIMAYLGPAISVDAFEVGKEVKDIFCNKYPKADDSFISISEGKYLADIYKLARLILMQQGITEIYGGQYCTVLERDNFFSYRRDGKTGRFGSFIWIDKS